MKTRKRNKRAKKKSKKYKPQVAGGNPYSPNDEDKDILKFYYEFDDVSIPKLFKEIEAYEKIIKPQTINSITVDASGKEGLTNVNLINQDKNIYHNSSLLVCAAHGAIENKYIKVPPNTIICFMSPMPYLNNIIEELYLQYMNNLSYYEFKQLLKFRTYNRHIRLNSLDRFSNCIKNSMWYYPDQLVPDTSQSINAHEFDTERKFYFEITFKKERVRRKRYQEDLFLQIFETDKLKFKSGVYNFYLSDILKKLPPRPGGFRLIMFDSCRCFYDNLSLEKQKQMIELEFYYSRLNAKNDLDEIREYLPSVSVLHFKCNFCFLTSMNETYIRDIKPIEEIKFDNKLKRYSYHPQTQHLVKMAKDFVRSPKKINRSDLKYLANLSTMKILKFFTSNGFQEPGITHETMGKILTKFINCGNTDKFLRIKFTFDFFKGKLHLIDFTNIDTYKHYIGGIMQLLELFHQHQLDASLDLMRDLQDFVKNCQDDEVLNYLVSKPKTLALAQVSNTTHNINKLDEIDVEHLVGKNFNFNFDILKELESGTPTGHLLAFKKFKGLRMARSIGVTNIESNGGIDNNFLETIFLKSTKPGIRYNINCRNLQKLDIRGLAFTNTYSAHLTKLSLTKTDLNTNILYFCKNILKDLSLTDVNLLGKTCFNFFNEIGVLKELKNLYVCALTDGKQLPGKNNIPTDFLKNMDRLSYLHLSELQDIKLNYRELISNIPLTAIKNIYLEINGIEEDIVSRSNAFRKDIPEYELQYKKLTESNT